jgi:hypothetical protein
MKHMTYTVTGENVSVLREIDANSLRIITDDGEVITDHRSCFVELDGLAIAPAVIVEVKQTEVEPVRAQVMRAIKTGASNEQLSMFDAMMNGGNLVVCTIGR